ncbi:GTP 3',8-cyclase MoaA [Sphingomonas sp.]|uniref:GTP 3',8-cyclase MoaA n=1 Tax=Sphingomonas sp. TaxID=28214 RepID=UPI00286CA4D2|nr:GTP 3',8-cyclase MoaA [Sphingomonas sp.]
MIDAYGRTITYLRLSVTDRCNLRCTYCMPAAMRFQPRVDLLDWDELGAVADAFVALGVRRLRLTGGEPLVRKGFVEFVGRLSRHLVSGALNEITMTTNGTELERHAEALARNGIRRINVSLDSLNPTRFAQITRGGQIDRVIAGIDAALAAGIAVKLNTVVLRNDNLSEVVELAEWAHGRGASISFIEVMPLGDVEQSRIDQHVPMAAARDLLDQRWTLTPSAAQTGGPARYFTTDEGGTIGFITPLSENFCGGCNRVRVTATGQLCFCLGQDEGVDLRAMLRNHAPTEPLENAIAAVICRKPLGHDFRIAAQVTGAVNRHMSVTGG